jgi:hypothetical protein
MKYFVFCLLLASAVSAQTRPRPAQGSAQQPVNMQGRVQEVSSRGISVELKDSRIVTFKVLPSTRFSDGLSLKVVQVGDRLNIQGTQDQEFNLTASAISLDAAAMAVDAIAARKAKMGDDIPAPVAQRPAAKDRDDDGPPVLRRGKPAPRSTASSDESATAASARSDSSLKGVRDRPVDEPLSAASEARPIPVPRPTNLNPKEELLERARDWALNFTDNLPNYVCQQYTTRYVRDPGRKDWRAMDVVSANVVYESGKEDYRNIAINGKPVNKKMEELPGSWSTGEFGTTLRSLFHSGRQADFTYIKQSNISGLTAWVYDYKVRKENSDWHVQVGSQSIIPAYTGRVWIEEKTAQVLRIEMSAVDIPKDFQLDQVESSNDYGFVRLATAEQYMLPTHAETLSCERGSPICSRNTIDFRNYHKYSGEANITFDK